MSAPASRRGIILGLAVAPIAGTASAATLPDPHVALAEEAVGLWRRGKALAWGWGYPSNSPEAKAADEAHSAGMAKCLSVCALPPPTTLPGLTALAVTVALTCEEMWPESRDPIDNALLQLLEAMLAFTGAAMPEEFAGLIHYPPTDSAEGGDR